MNQLAPPSDYFDPEYYLATNPDVLDGIRDGYFLDGYHHYTLHGRAEGRLAVPAFDADWYLTTYPMARLDLEQGRAATAWHHYLRLGKYRGYLPNPHAPRPNNPSLPRDRFGGLWTDQPDARDIILGRLSIGALTEATAAALLHWVEHGYVIIKNAISLPLLEAARAELDRAYNGEIDGLLFQCLTLSNENIPWQPAINDKPAKALDLHAKSAITRDLIFAPPIVQFLNLIFEQKPLASQSLGFLRGSGQPAHQDTAYVVYSHPRRFAASWIALEDVKPGAGELLYYPGSHALPDYLYGDHHKSIHEARRTNAAGDNSLRAREEFHSHSLVAHANHRNLPEKTLIVAAGDALIWHADLAHGGKPISSADTRRSVVTHYCPATIAPLSFESGKSRLEPHDTTGFFSSVVY